MRLRGRREFQESLRRGRRASGRFFRWHWKPRDAAMSRLGLVISRQVGAAVVRNRIKRVVRETFRRERDAMPIADWVCVILPAAGPVTNAPLREELTRFLQSVKRRTND